jgi:hypothetical protein
MNGQCSPNQIHVTQHSSCANAHHKPHHLGCANHQMGCAAHNNPHNAQQFQNNLNKLNNHGPSTCPMMKKFQNDADKKSSVAGSSKGGKSRKSDGQSKKYDKSRPSVSNVSDIKTVTTKKSKPRSRRSKKGLNSKKSGSG